MFTLATFGPRWPGFPPLDELKCTTASLHCGSSTCFLVYLSISSPEDFRDENNCKPNSFTNMVAVAKVNQD